MFGEHAADVHLSVSSLNSYSISMENPPLVLMESNAC